jgi:hypothetical protein
MDWWDISTFWQGAPEAQWQVQGLSAAYESLSYYYGLDCHHHQRGLQLLCTSVDNYWHVLQGQGPCEGAMVMLELVAETPSWLKVT